MYFQLQGCAGIIRSTEKGAGIVTVFVASTVLLPLVPTKYAQYAQLSGGYAWVGPSGREFSAFHHFWIVFFGKMLRDESKTPCHQGFLDSS